MKPYAFIGARSAHRVDYSQTCADCRRFPNRCDHIGAPIIFLQMIEDDPIAEFSRELEHAEATAPPLAEAPPFRLEAEPATATAHQKGLFNGE